MRGGYNQANIMLVLKRRRVSPIFKELVQGYTMAKLSVTRQEKILDVIYDPCCDGSSDVGGGLGEEVRWAAVLVLGVGCGIKSDGGYASIKDVVFLSKSIIEVKSIYRSNMGSD